MDHTGVTPLGAVTADELTELVLAEGPFLSVYLTTEAEIDNAAQRAEQRWKPLRAALVEAGAAEEALEAVDPLVADAHLMGQCLAVFATAGGVVHVEHHPDAPARDVCRWAPLPLLAPLLEWRQASPPHVAVLADRQGADLFGLRAAAPNIQRQVQGGEELVGRSTPHGESQRRNHHRVESLWEHNAKVLSDEVVRLVDQVEARLVVAAGDVRALQLLQEALPKEVLDKLEVVGGGRSPDGSVDGVVTDVDRLVEAAVAHDTELLRAKFREELGQGDRAADGPARTLEALSMAQVEALLVGDDLDDDRQAWFGPEPSQVALTADTLQAFGVETPQRARLVDVAVRGALGTGAGVRVIPAGGEDGAGEGPSGGIGAILRWS
ncbi:MAG: hypothetical protein M3396_08385 [Actinomycetota bacterium]|nr:hypothetical protein [Actinomycetota bacterium]MDQ3573816.1 hypothetical protein [Actinomycetota bacterium]